MRNWKKLEADKFFADLDLNNLSLETDDLEKMLKKYENVVNRNLDKCAEREEYGESTRHNITGQPFMKIINTISNGYIIIIIIIIINLLI